MNPETIIQEEAVITGRPLEAPKPTEPPGRNGSDAAGESPDFLSFYGLRENPFADSVNPSFFYKTGNHADAYQRMMLSIEQDISLAMVTGVSGTGKTLVTQMLLQGLDPEKYLPVLVLISPGLSKTGLLREILSELNVALPVGINRTRDLIKLLSNRIIDLYHEGQKLVLLIDECHFLSADNLHILRTISNIEIPERKLSTCLLFGEAQFARRLRHPSYASLRNRMYMQCELLPMSPEDTEQYVKYRLMTAGRLRDLITPDAFTVLHQVSHGVCRHVNKVCMLALVEGFLCRSACIDAGLMEQGAALD